MAKRRLPLASTKGKLWRLTLAAIIIDRSGVAPDIEHEIRPSRGMTRHLSVRSLLIVTLFTKLLDRPVGASSIWTVIIEDIIAVNPRAARALGLFEADGSPISKNKIDYLLCRINKCLDPSPYRLHGPTGQQHLLTADEQQRRRDVLNDVVDRLLTAPIADVDDVLPKPDVLALDGTDLETWARPYGRARRAAIQQSLGLEPETRLGRVDPARPAPKANRQAHREIDAAYGHRTKTQQHPSEIFGGFTVVTAATAHSHPGPRVPNLTHHLRLIPADGNVPATGIDLLDRWVESGHTLAIVAADRQFTVADGFYPAIRAHGGTLVADLYNWGRGARGTLNPSGALRLHGWPYCVSTPETLHDPGAIPRRRHRDGSPNPAYEAWRARYRALHRYACQRIATRTSHHTFRFRCPAMAGTVRCPLCAASMSLPSRGRPLIKDPPKRWARPPVCAGKTFQMVLDDDPKTEMDWEWGSRQWEDRYRPGRSAVEGDYGVAKSPFGMAMARGFDPGIGLARHSIMAAIALTGVNLIMLKAWWADVDRRTLDASAVTRLNSAPVLADPDSLLRILIRVLNSPQIREP